MKKKIDEVNKNKTGSQKTTTLRKLAKASQLKIEEKFRDLLENVQEGYFEIDLAGKFTFINDSVCRVLGYSRKEVMNINSREFTDQDEVKEVFQAYNEVYKTKKPLKDFKWHIIRKDSSKRYLEGSISLRKDLSGKPIGFRVIANDFTERKRAEEMLKESEKKYRLLADNIQDVVFIMDMNLNYTYLSPSVKLLRGYEPEEAMKHTPEETVTPSSMDLSLRILSEMMEIEKSEHRDINISRTAELEMIRKDGTTVWVETKAFFIRDENLKPIGIMGVTRDITERKKAEETLRQSEEKYRTILEDIQEGYFEVDLAGNFTFFNNSLFRYFGYSKEELMGMNYLQYTDKEHSEELFQAYNKVYKTGESTEGFDWQIIRKDGTKRYVEASMSLRKDSSGKPIGFRGIARDITENKMAEEKLKETLESLRTSIKTTIQVLSTASEARDPYTAGHQKRVADLARVIATEIGLAQEKIEGIRMAGIIHDIGKLSIPAEILSKPTKLTEIEFSLIKEHAQSGYDMLKNVESPWPLAQIVYQHHERMNGSGYPRNLKGDEILMEARIMAVADVVEAMASHRPYRPTLGIEAALEEIEKNKGILYDDTVADACLKLFREKRYQLK